MRGANENNLRSVDVDVLREAIVAFTGVSGSGKSSLAFGTIFSEAQRRYLESVAPYARRLIQQGHNPQVESITGLPPAVALQQRRGALSSRSSVGTVTTLSNSLRMLFSRAGTFPDGFTTRLGSDAFSPNTAAGACPECHGIGVAHSVTEDTLVPDPSLSIRDGAIAAWPGAWQAKNLRDITIALSYDVDRPWRDLDPADREWILVTDEQPVVEFTPQRDRVAKPYMDVVRGADWIVDVGPGAGEGAVLYSGAVCRNFGIRSSNSPALRTTPPQGTSPVELATLEWVWWWNNQRLHGELDMRTPTEVESTYYADQESGQPAPPGQGSRQERKSGRFRAGEGPRHLESEPVAG